MLDKSEIFFMKALGIFQLFIMIFLLSGCSDNRNDETIIREQIENLQIAIEQHDRSQFMAIIDSEYYDKLNSDPQSLQRMLLGFFLRYKDISIFASAHQFKMMQIRAEVQSQVVITGGKGLLPERARHYKVKSCWKKDSDEWLLSCLDWE